MKMHLLASVAAAALVLSVGAANSQQSGPGSASGAASGASSAQSPTGANSSAPAQNRGAQSSQNQPGAGAERSTGQAPGLDRQNKSPAGVGQGSDRAQERRTGQSTSDDGQRTGGRASDNNAAKPGAGGNGAAAQKGGESDRSKSMTTGSTGGADVKVTSEQQTRLRTVVSKTNIREVNNVNVSVSVGTVLPPTVELVALPSEIIEIVPQFRSYRVIKVGGRLLIVEPGSRRIVYIINV